MRLAVGTQCDRIEAEVCSILETIGSSARVMVGGDIGSMSTIRPSTPEDGERIMDIWRRSVDATHDFLSPEDRRSIETELVAFLPSAPLHLAVDDCDRPIGFMLLDGSHMEALFIDPNYRGKGVGRALVEHALAMYPGLTTDVNEQNTQAVGFYEHLSFKRAGRSELDDQGRPYPLIHLRHSDET